MGNRIPDYRTQCMCWNPKTPEATWCDECAAVICEERGLKFCASCRRLTDLSRTHCYECAAPKPTGQRRLFEDMPERLIDAVIERDLKRKRAARWGRL
jgi:hypothetical protein